MIKSVVLQRRAGRRVASWDHIAPVRALPAKTAPGHYVKSETLNIARFNVAQGFPSGAIIAEGPSDELELSRLIGTSDHQRMQ